MLARDRASERDTNRSVDRPFTSTPATGGAPLSPSLQQRARRSIHADFDFSGVRIHRDDARVSRHNAAAYTIARDVVLGNDVGPLTSPQAMRLLGHELGHVVQQSRGGSGTTPPWPGTALEEAAECAGHSFEAGRPGRVEGAAQVGIARTPKSLSRSLEPSMMSDFELEAEIREIRTWLTENPASTPDRSILEQAMAGLEDEVFRRQGPSSLAAISPSAAMAGTECTRCHDIRPDILPPPAATSGAECTQCHDDRPDAFPSPVAATDAACGVCHVDRSTPVRWVPIIQHYHLGTFGDTTVIVTSPSQGAVQWTPDPSAGYNFDTYITNPATGELIPAQHLGGTRYRVFMGTPECPGCHLGNGLVVDLLGQNPLLIFGPSLLMTSSELLMASRAAPLGAVESMASSPSGAGFTPRVIPGGRGAAAPAWSQPPAFSGNNALQLAPDVVAAQAPMPALRLVPAPAQVPLPVEPPLILPSPGLPAAAAVVSTMASTGASPQVQPVMPAGLTTADQELWRTCNQLHNTYKTTQAEAGAYAATMDPLKHRLMQNQASQQDRLDFCALLDERIRIVQRLHQERLKYIRLDCDRFDWFARGTTAAERLAWHRDELDNVAAQLRNFFDLRNRLCL